MRHPIRNTIRTLVTLTGVALIIAGIANNGLNPLSGGGNDPGLGPIMVGVIILFVYWGFALVDWVTDKHQVILRAASTRIPEPQEIADQIYATTGQWPSIHDVESIQNMAIHRRNEAAIAAGLSLGALFFAAHDFKL